MRKCHDVLDGEKFRRGEGGRRSVATMNLSRAVHMSEIIRMESTN